MADNETSQKERNRLLTLFLANTRSVKGKTTELQFLSNDYNIICLTETHLNHTIPSSNLLPTEDRSVFRQDRTLHGGGVLIAASNSIKPKQIHINTFREEIVCIKVEPKTIICCYYRPHVYLQNTENIKHILGEITDKYHDHNMLLVGDMNFPEIDWKKEQLKANSKHRKLHQEFLDILNENGLKQLISEPTHVKGNTLDLICTNNRPFVLETSRHTWAQRSLHRYSRTRSDHTATATG